MANADLAGIGEFVGKPRFGPDGRGPALGPRAALTTALNGGRRVDRSSAPGLIMRFSWGKVAEAHVGIGALMVGLNVV